MKFMRIPVFIAMLLLGSDGFAQDTGINLVRISRELFNGNYTNSDVRKLISLNNGSSLWVPEKYSNKRTGTIDSEMGELTGPDLKIGYDIGFSAGAHMGAHQKNQCASYYDTVINGQTIALGLIKSDAGQKKLVITNWGDYLKNAFSYPANFWAFVKEEKDAWEVLQIAFSYKQKNKQ